MRRCVRMSVRMSVEREKVRFASGGTEGAAWHYPGTNGVCVIMAGGGGVTKEPGTDLFARRFCEAGFGVLAFDYRRLGESGGQPRQIVRIGEQLADWAAAIAQTPTADGPAAARNAARHQKPLVLLRLFGRGVADAIGGLAGRPPRLVPLAGEPGTVALLTTPDGRDGNRALNPSNRYPEWQQAVAARLALRLGFYRPGRHYAPFMDGHEQAAGAELSFLRRHLLDHPRADRPGAVAADSALQGGTRA